MLRNKSHTTWNLPRRVVLLSDTESGYFCWTRLIQIGFNQVQNCCCAGNGSNVYANTQTRSTWRVYTRIINNFFRVQTLCRQWVTAFFVVALLFTSQRHLPLKYWMSLPNSVAVMARTRVLMHVTCLLDSICVPYVAPLYLHVYLTCTLTHMIIVQQTWSREQQDGCGNDMATCNGDDIWPIQRPLAVSGDF